MLWLLLCLILHRVRADVVDILTRQPVLQVVEYSVVAGRAVAAVLLLGADADADAGAAAGLDTSRATVVLHRSQRMTLGKRQ